MYIFQSGYGMMLLYSLIIGGALGAVYDVFRILRVARSPVNYFTKRLTACRSGAGEAQPDGPESEGGTVGQRAAKRASARFAAVGELLIFAEDILFSALSALTVIVLVFYANYGRIRWFALAGCLVGFVVYYLTLGRIVMLFSELIIGAVRFCVSQIVSFVWRLTVRPAARLIKAVNAKLRAEVTRRAAESYTEREMKKLICEAGRGFGWTVSVPAERGGKKSECSESNQKRIFSLK